MPTHQEMQDAANMNSGSGWCPGGRTAKPSKKVVGKAWVQAWVLIEWESEENPTNDQVRVLARQKWEQEDVAIRNNADVQRECDP